MPLFKTLICAYRESVPIFHSFQVINTTFFMFWLIVCDKRGIFITMNDSSLFLTSKPIFQNRYMQFTTSFWAVWIMGLPKQLKSRSFWGPLDPWPRLCPGPTVGFTALWPQHHFQVFKFDNMHTITLHFVLIKTASDWVQFSRPAIKTTHYQ